MKIEVVDLFCGVGGLSAGFRNAGLDVLAGFDLDTSCRYAYEKNIDAKFVSANVAELAGADVAALYSPKAVKVLVGCAPCQPFSMYTGRYRQNETAEDTDKRWELLRAFARIIEEVQPDVVSMENVPRVAIHPAFNSFVDRLKTACNFSRFHRTRKE